MSMLARRREADCVSDLKLDRWLLGESPPGSDEARQLEHHLAQCDECSSRLRSLRSLYSAGTQPSHPAPPQPVRVQAAGLMQVIILRDGLLVGTEMFTAGRWVLGGPEADLVLGELPRGHQTVLRFHEGRVSVEARCGSVFVNGHRVGDAELRPIDELCLGPWVLRTRVVSERWAEKPVTQLRALAPLQDPVQAQLEAKTEIVRLLPSKPSQLKLELWWGDRLLAVQSFDENEEVPGSVFEALGAAPLMVSRERQQCRMFWGQAGEGELVGPDAPLTLTHSSGLIIRASMIAKVAPPPPAPLQAPRLVVVLAVLFAGVPVGLSQVEHSDEDELTSRPIPRVFVHPVAPPPRLKKNAVPDAPSPPRHAATPPRTAPPRSAGAGARAAQRMANGLAGLFRSMPSVEASLTRVRPGRGSSSVVGSLPSGGGTMPGGLLGFSNLPPTGSMGLGSAGVLGRGTYGPGAVGARVESGGSTSRSAPGSNASIDKDAVLRVIQEHTSEISACYEAALLTHEGLKGTSKLEWRIDPSGHVTAAKLLTGTLRDNGAVTGCILSKLKHWRFPSAKGGEVVVSNNFVFQQSSY